MLRAKHIQLLYTCCISVVLKYHCALINYAIFACIIIKHMKRYTKLCLIICITIMSGCSSVINKNDFARVEGMDIILPSGDKLNIKGTNLGHWLNPEGYMIGIHKNANSASRINQAFCEMIGPEKTSEFWQKFKDNYITQSDIAFIKSSGANTIRIPFHYKLFTREDYMGLNDENEGFKRLDSLVSWCKKEQIYLILDMHDAPGGQTGDNIDDSYGYPWLFESPRCQDLFVDIWVRIAEHYKNETIILGYDLMNEPIATYFKDNEEELNKKLEPLYIKTTKAIREVDKNHIIILGGAQWNSIFSVFTDWEFDDNIMYSCHRYKGGTSKEAIQSFIDFRDRTNLPMWMGETGHNTYEWLHDFRITMEENNIGWTYWPYKKMGESSFVNVKEPADWNLIIQYAESTRSSYDSIRQNRPDAQIINKAMDEYIENMKFKNCIVESKYIDALGLKTE